MRAPNERAESATQDNERSGDAVQADWGGVAQPHSDMVYNDDVFSYFLEIERHRSRISGQPFLLLVITLDGEPGDVIPSETSKNVFAALSASIRDTDFVGWYSGDKAIGAVLIQSVDFSKVDAAGLVSARLANALAGRLPQPLVERLRFRLCQIAAEREVWS